MRNFFSSLLDRAVTLLETISGVQPVKGMGAIPHLGGVYFRVWAPHAHEVYVTGTFDNWSKTTYRLRHESNGYFGGNILLAKTGDEYRFYLKTASGDFFKNDPYAKEMTHSQGNSVVHDSTTFDWEEDNQFKMVNWNDLVIYEMHVGTFHRKNKNVNGDLYTAIEKLDYLKDLGVNAIELMPITEFPGDLSWGYNPAHSFAVETHYGGAKALKQFIKAAHKKEIAVLIDVVYNHLGPSDLDLWQFDGWSTNNGGGIYFYNDWRAKTPWGHTRPDYGRQEVRQFLRDNALMWLDEFHADGLRLDMTAYIRNVNADGNPQNDIPAGHEFLKWINHEVNLYHPHKIVIAEDMHQLDYITEAKERGGLGFDTQWDSKFVHTIREVLIQPNDEYRNLLAVEQAILHKYNNNAFRRVIYTESHDEVANGKARLPEDISPGKADSWVSKKKSALGMAIVMTSPGIPMIFQGQPLLEDKWFCDTDPLDWQRLIQFQGNVKLYQDLIRLRKNWYNHTNGLRGHHVKTLYLNMSQGVLAYHRWENGGKRDSTVIVLNFKNQVHSQIAIKFPIPGIWLTRFNSDSKLYDLSYTNLGIAQTTTNSEGWASVNIAPYSALILSMD
jgi:1,4-alpha-glucan branching enzyme